MQCILETDQTLLMLMVVLICFYFLVISITRLKSILETMSIKVNKIYLLILKFFERFLDINMIKYEYYTKECLRLLLNKKSSF